MAAPRSPDGPRYERILVGSDGSSRASRAVERAVELAKLTGASLTILGVGSGEKLRERLEEQARSHADASGIEADVRVERGNVAQVLMDVAASGGYDLLVLGNKGMTGLERLRLGSVPNKVSHHLPCSLLIVRTGS